VRQGSANGTTRHSALTGPTRSPAAEARHARGAGAYDAPSNTTGAAASGHAPADPAVLERSPAERSDAAADLSRMIAELNEVRMRLDAIVRKLSQSAVELPSSEETVDDVERLRMRLVGKLDRIREQLVTRLDEERVTRER
jgi:hypothetical protein